MKKRSEKMGLDMYLLSIPKVKGLTFDETLTALSNVRRHMNEKDEIYEKLKADLDLEEFSSRDSIYDEIAYWPKANQIHNWFVENLHNGVDEPLFTVMVTPENLWNLHHHCFKIISGKSHPADHLPTRPGCFFGSYSYDDFYYHQVQETESILSNLLQNFNFDTRYLLYQCSW
jgi:hypothetical protein